MAETQSNGKVATEVAEQVVQEEVTEPAKLWLHPDALRPRDYIRGKVALKDVLAELKMSSCYDFLASDEMYPFLIWALKSRDNANFGWEDALDTEFSEFRMGDERPPQTQLPASSGSSETTPSVSGSKPPRPKRAPAPSSASGMG